MIKEKNISFPGGDGDSDLPYISEIIILDKGYFGKRWYIILSGFLQLQLYITACTTFCTNGATVHTSWHTALATVRWSPASA